MKRLKYWTRHYLDGKYQKILEQHNFTCISCGSTQNVIVHHKDTNRKNNDLDNLKVVCRSCHAKDHNQHLTWRSPNHDLIIELREYGYTYQKIADYLGISRQRVHQILSKLRA